MTNKYQAAIGPDMVKLHIYAPDPETPRYRPSLCERVNVARNYQGAVSMSRANLCKRCFSILQKSLDKDAAITAELIGVSAIIE